MSVAAESVEPQSPWPAPPGTPWTVADVLALPEDGWRTELVDGSLIVSPNPAVVHQRVCGRLGPLLQAAADAVGADVEVLQGVNVEVPAGLLIPDVAVVRGPDADIGGVVLPAEALVAVVEIVSPSSRRMDRLVKPGVYAEAGISCYWRLELGDEPMLTAYELRGGAYAEVPAEPHAEGRLVTVPYPVIVDLPRLLRR